jgi:riboflavin kinase/FMN adenylyltransferase
MKFPAQIEGLENASLPPCPLHLAIGMFDGVHLGHRAVIESAVQSARGNGELSGVLTFWPHPSALLRPANPTRLIHGAAMKSRRLVELGVDVVITHCFTPKVAEVLAEDFLPWLKQCLPHLAAVYIGENFRFGQDRRGDVALLVAAGRQHGVRVFSAPRVNLDGEPISSTRIRALLVAGDMQAANAQFGYRYSAEGVVAPGKRLGRTLGFPTLNVAWAPDLQPRYGVYAVSVARPDGLAGRPAVANYGVRPTVEDGATPRLEAHLLGDCPFGEGDAVTIEWFSFLRPEMKFPGVEELRAQIARDRQTAEAYFGG